MSLEIQGAFALAPVGLREEARALRIAVGRGAAAILFYHAQIPELYSAGVAEGDAPVPCVTIRRADALQLVQEPQEVELDVEVKTSDALGVNIVVDVGNQGRALLLLANYDARPGAPGAYRNASGVAGLLELLERLQGWRGRRVLVGFVDGEERGAVGSRHCRDVLHATGLLGGLRGVVYVSGLGLRRLLVASTLRKAHSRLSDLVMQLTAEEGVLASCPAPARAEEIIPQGIWSCPVIAITGPPMAIEHTALDRPDVLHPRYVSAAVSILEGLARTW